MTQLVCFGTIQVYRLQSGRSNYYAIAPIRDNDEESAALNSNSQTSMEVLQHLEDQKISLELLYCFLKVKEVYEVCPKSNETGVIKTVLKSIKIYQSQIPSK